VGVVYNPLTGTLDFTGAAQSGSVETIRNVQEFFVSAWVLDGSDYKIVIPFSTHQIQNPKVSIYELVGGSYEQVFSSVSFDSNFNITIKTQSNPDNRFQGLLVII
jgi:hypothetical protein